MARSLLTAGVTWRHRAVHVFVHSTTWPRGPRSTERVWLAWVFSVGGYRSFMLSALLLLPKAVDVCRMTTFASQIKSHVAVTMGESFLDSGGLLLFRFAGPCRRHCAQSFDADYGVSRRLVPHRIDDVI